MTTHSSHHTLCVIVTFSREHSISFTWYILCMCVMYAKKKYSTVDEFERVLFILARKDYICAMCAQVHVCVHPSVRACLNIYMSIVCIQPAIHWVLTTQNTITSLFGHQFYRPKVKNVYKYIPFKSVSAVFDFVILEPWYGPWNGRKKFVKFPNVVDCRCW